MIEPESSGTALDVTLRARARTKLPAVGVFVLMAVLALGGWVLLEITWPLTSVAISTALLLVPSGQWELCLRCMLELRGLPVAVGVTA